MKIKTKSLKKITSVVITQDIVEAIIEEWERYKSHPGTAFSTVIEEDGDVTEFVLEEDQWDYETKIKRINVWQYSFRRID